MLLDVLSDPQIWISLFTLTALEIVLGIDNLVFLAILAERLPMHQRLKAWRLGLGFALVSRLALLASLAWLVGLSEPVFNLFGTPMSWRDVILIAGGLFLLAKATHEIHGSIEGDHDQEIRKPGAIHATFGSVIVQAVVLDMVFSLDSVITAVGMADHLWVMMTAVVLAVVVMLLAAEPLSNFVTNFPTIKMLALSFMLLIGVALIADGFQFHIPKAYIYFAMGFSVFVESMNLLVRRTRLSMRQKSLQEANKQRKSPGGRGGENGTV